MRQLRDNYLSYTQSDPLGAYLTTRDYSHASSKSSTTKGLAGTALSYLGIKYRYGGGAPSTGFDCSGLVIYAAEKSLGLKLPRKSAEIAREGESVKLSELKKGDLVFFNTRGHRFSHVGIYLGDKKFVHAPRTGSVVRVENMDQAYWKKRYNGARRLAANDAPANLYTSK
jgi:cell wall-associated NlpC family hydrolase